MLSSKDYDNKKTLSFSINNGSTILTSIFSYNLVVLYKDYTIFLLCPSKVFRLFVFKTQISHLKFSHLSFHVNPSTHAQYFAYSLS